MTLRGTVQLGKIVLDPGQMLPDGTRVDVRTKTGARSVPSKATRGGRSRRATRPSAKVNSIFDAHKLAVRTGIRDLAEQHDHYIYGTPKRRVSKRTPARRTR